jgi:hypothetical protein
MDLFDTCTWAHFIVETTFLGTPTIHFPFIKSISITRYSHKLQFSYSMFNHNDQHNGRWKSSINLKLVIFSILCSTCYSSICNKFLYIQEALEHVFTVWIYDPTFHMLFFQSKTGLLMWISPHPTLEIDDSLIVPYV